MPAELIHPDANLNFRFHSEAYDVHKAILARAQAQLAKNRHDVDAYQTALAAASKMTEHLHHLNRIFLSTAGQA